jgi:hypothetical protein
MAVAVVGFEQDLYTASKSPVASAFAIEQGHLLCLRWQSKSGDEKRLDSVRVFRHGSTLTLVVVS